MLPWAVWSVRRLLTSDRPGSLCLDCRAKSGRASRLCDILTLFLAVPFLAGYIVTLWWQGGHRSNRLAWATVGIAAGVGISAFFWLPLIVEGAYLSDFGYKIASEQFLPENVWRW